MRRCSEMPYHTGLVLRFYPSRNQKRFVAVNDGCRRVVYNRLVALGNEQFLLKKTASLVPAEKDRLEYIGSILHNPDTALPAALKNAMPFLYGEGVDSLAVDNAIKNYRSAWKKFREDPHAGIPVFHKKGYEQSYQTNAHYRKDAACINDGNVRFEDAHHLVLPVLGRVRVKGSPKRVAEIMGRKDTRIGSITIRKDSIGRYFVSLQLASETPFAEGLPQTGTACGIDLNVENFLWDSDGHVVENPHFRKNLQGRIASVQKGLSRKKEQAKKDGRPLRGCKNYQKDRLKLAKLHAKVKGRADAFRHAVSRGYVENQDIIVAEDLKVKNLLKNHALAFAISECGWSDFLHKLEYKASMYGKVFIKVPPHYTTQTCSCCGHVLKGDDKLTLGDREWICPVCGTYHLRDYNASKVVLAKGMAALSLL